MAPARAADSGHEQFKQRLDAATLAEKRQLLREWALNVLPELAGAASSVDPKFAGVQATGRKVLQLDLTQPVDVDRELFGSEDYWRGVMEMVRGNQLIAELPVFFYLAGGEWERADRLITILAARSEEKSLAGRHLADARDFLKVCLSAMTREISRGVELHDKGRYAEAVAVYRAVLDAGIRSARARYELFYSQVHENREQLMGLMSGKDTTPWDDAAKEIYAIDPLYSTQMSGKRGRDMGALQDRVMLRMLENKPPKDMGEMLPLYAELALNLEVYPVAAHLYWTMIDLKKVKLSTDEIIMRYLYCLEKMGATNLKQNFKGDFTKKFEQLEAELVKHRKM